MAWPPGCVGRREPGVRDGLSIVRVVRNVRWAIRQPSAPATQAVLVGPDGVDPVVGVAGQDGDGVDVGEGRRLVAVHLDLEVREEVLGGAHPGMGVLHERDQVAGSPPRPDVAVVARGVVGEAGPEQRPVLGVDGPCVADQHGYDLLAVHAHRLPTSRLGRRAAPVPDPAGGGHLARWVYTCQPQVDGTRARHVTTAPRMTEGATTDVRPHDPFARPAARVADDQHSRMSPIPRPVPASGCPSDSRRRWPTLLEAGLEEVRDVGFEKMTIRSVAQRAGHDPHDRLQLLHLEGPPHLRAALAPDPGHADPDDSADESFVGRVRAAFEEPAATLAADPVLSRAVFMAIISDEPEVRRLRGAVAAELIGRLRIALGPFDDPELVGTLFMAYSGAMMLVGTGTRDFLEVIPRMETRRPAHRSFLRGVTPTGHDRSECPRGRGR